MKRDMELIRKMVLAVEEGPNGYAPDDLRIEGHTAEQLGYHAHLLIQDGFATGPITTHINGSGPSAQITALTWSGHDLADAVRDASHRPTRVHGVGRRKAAQYSVQPCTV